MKTLDDLRRVFLFAAAAYLVLLVPRMHAAQPHAAPFRHVTAADVIAGVERGLEGLAESQEATGAFFPGN